LYKNPRVGWEFPDSPFCRVWRELMVSPVIPYAVSERRDRFPKAFRDLEDYITKWEYFKGQGCDAMKDYFPRKNVAVEKY
jgi:hypothetical protein